MRYSHALPSALVTALALSACGGEGSGGSGSTELSRTDSAGVEIVNHPAGAWDAAPAWKLSPEPLAVIGGDPEDAELDLSSSQVGTMTDDGQVLAATMEPAQLYLFSADGSERTDLGRGGEGPGEYRFLSGVIMLGGDTAAAYDLFTREVHLYDISDRNSIGRIQFPLSGTMVPPIMVGRLNDGTWVTQVVNPMAEAPEGAPEIYRIDNPVLTWRDGAEAFDTLATLPGQESIKGTIEAGGQSMTMGRAIAYGANSWVGGRTDLIWSTRGDHFELEGRTGDGTLKRIVRLPGERRPVTAADREGFIAVLREQLERARTMAMVPPGLIDSEIEKLDDTRFATNHPAIGQMFVDAGGRIWVTPDLAMIDSSMTWAVLTPEGEILGRFTLPGGFIIAAGEDRVVIRREDETTGMVTLEVWGIEPA